MSLINNTSSTSRIPVSNFLEIIDISDEDAKACQCDFAKDIIALTGSHLPVAISKSLLAVIRDHLFAHEVRSGVIKILATSMP